MSLRVKAMENRQAASYLAGRALYNSAASRLYYALFLLVSESANLSGETSEVHKLAKEYVITYCGIEKAKILI